jgi:hypothetical protein
LFAATVKEAICTDDERINLLLLGSRVGAVDFCIAARA